MIARHSVPTPSEHLDSSDADASKTQASKAVQTAGPAQALASLGEVAAGEQQLEAIRRRSEKAQLVLRHLEAKSEQETAKLVAKYMEVRSAQQHPRYAHLKIDEQLLKTVYLKEKLAKHGADPDGLLDVLDRLIRVYGRAHTHLAPPDTSASGAVDDRRAKSGVRPAATGKQKAVPDRSKRPPPSAFGREESDAFDETADGKGVGLPKTGPRSAAVSVEEAVDRVARRAESKQYFLLKNEDAPPHRRYKLVAEIFADKHLLTDLKPFIDSGLIAKLAADPGVGAQRQAGRSRSREAFPQHHYTKEIIDSGAFDNSFEEWLFDPIIRAADGSARMQQAAARKREQELRLKSQKTTQRPVTDTFYLLNKKRLGLPDPHPQPRPAGRKPPTAAAAKHTLAADRKPRRGSDSSEEGSRSKSRSRRSEARENNYFEEVDDDDARAGSAGLREAARKRGVRSLNIADINAEHHEQLLRSVQQHADKPPAPDRPPPAQAPAQPQPPEPQPAVAAEQPRAADKPAPPVQSAALKPPEDKAPTHQPHAASNKSPQASPKAPPRDPADAPADGRNEVQTSSSKAVQSPQQQEAAPTQAPPQQHAPADKPLDSSSQQQHAVPTSEPQDKPAAAEQKKGQSPPSSAAKPEGQGLKSNPFLSKQQPPASKPNPFTKQLQSTAAPDPLPKPPANPGAPNKPAGGLAIKPFPGGANKPSTAADTGASPAKSAAQAEEKAEQVSVGVKNNPFLNKQANNKLAPADSKPLPKSPSSDLKTSELLRDNPFLKPKEPTPPPPAPPKSPRGSQDEKIKGLSGIWK